MMMGLRGLLFAAASSSIICTTHAATVEFFYTETLDTCAIHQEAMQANEQTTHGGVCAYQADTGRVYGCPAPDPTCWTWYQTCNDNNVGQTVCNRGGTVWCCNAVAGETCTTTDGQINVCISNFTSPNSGVDVDTANSVYLSAIGVSNVTATSQATDPVPFSTRIIGATSSSSAAATTSGGSTSITTSASGTSSQTSSSGPSTSQTGSTAGSVTNATADSTSSGLSSGAIAGIVIGAIAGLALIGAAACLLGKKRRNERAAKGTPELGPETSGGTAYASNDDKARLGGYYASDTTSQAPPPSEMGTDYSTRVEMPVTQPGANASAAQRRYEMP